MTDGQKKRLMRVLAGAALFAAAILIPAKGYIKLLLCLIP